MSTIDYLQCILESQTLDDKSQELTNLEKHRKDVDALLRQAFKRPSIRYAGSKAKGTIIKVHHDLDLACYLPHDDASAGTSLRQIYDSVEKELSKPYFVERKRSALRLKAKQNKESMHIDVVPGQFVDDSQEDVFIHQEDAQKSRLKTNLQKHVDHVKGSGCTEAIQLLKYWRHRHSLTRLKTFPLELTVIKASQDARKTTLKDQIVAFWEYVVNADRDLGITDPANPTGNDLSGIVDASTRTELAALARNALANAKKEVWEPEFGEVRGTATTESLKAAAAARGAGTRPWCWP